MTPDNGSPAGHLRRAEVEPDAALAGHRQALRQQLLEGASGADVMAALTEFVDGLIIGRYRDAMRNEADPNTEIN